jgi:hypothetical protein
LNASPDRLRKISPKGGLRKAAELGRFLGKQADEIERMMVEDGLPHVRLPGRTKPSVRFHLRDVHAWLVRYAPGSVLGDYAEFARAFEEAQG